MSIHIQKQLATLRASVVEGRAENVRYRQDQLYALHNSLRESVTAITSAIANDASCNSDEADAEFYLGMDAVKKSYETLDFDESLKTEYLVANGKSNEDRRVALGIVALRPSKHGRFYSVLSPLVVALATGNCILVELDGSSPSVDLVLREVLVAGLDQDTFQISTSALNDMDLLNIDVLVDQKGTSQSSALKTVASSAQSRTIAIVDRSSNIEIAAKAIVDARISSKGSSPYSPDLVIINEFVGEAFGMACLKYASSCALSPTNSVRSSKAREVQTLVNTEERDGKVKVHRSRSAGTDLVVVEILDRKSPLAQTKIEGPYIVLLPSTGLVDSVDSQRSSSPFLACFAFGSLATCKFISEQISSPTTYINHIPEQLLIGPASPAEFPHTLHPRYTADMFSVPRPQFVIPPEALPTASKLKDVALKKLMPTGQRPGHALGFFEQGILLGLGSAALVVLPVLGWSLFWAGKQGWKFIGAKMK